MNWRRNWRIYLLVALVVLSGIALFMPGDGSAQAQPGDGTGSGPGNGTAAGNATGNGTGANDTALFEDQSTGGEGITNLKFGLELSGGTRLRAGLVGVTAENVPVSNNIEAIERTVAEQLDLELTQVNARPPNTRGESGVVEIYSENVTVDDGDEIRAALEAAGIDTAEVTVEDGVTEETWEEARQILGNKINRGGLTGGQADVIQSPTGDRFLVVEVPNAGRSEVLDLVGDQGRVELVASYPERTDNGTVQREVSLLDRDSLQRIGQPQEGQGGQPYVRVTVEEGEATQTFADVLNENGFTSEGVGNCRWETNPDDPGWCLKTIVDGEVVYAAGLSPGLAEMIQSGEWTNSRVFRMETTTFAQAQELNIHLQAGALPTDLDIQSQVYLQPSLAQKFKPLALLTGIVAWITVSAVIFYRYREIRVAVPMLLTAFAEVWILLGFAVAVGLALDLSHIAGLIAVIGTGVDDLVIIADEIMQRGEIATDRVFKNRFRKAFWVIGAAAVTTIIAMSPLAVLSLGDLQGFAIITIVGVLIGVLITRPAYGDILRNLLLANQK